MIGDTVDLYLASNEVAGHQDRLRETLLAIPGVSAVQIVGLDGQTVESRILVQFDAEMTTPIVMEERLAGAGFSVLSAAEHRRPPRERAAGA